jgi:hypothetical protein
MALVITINYSTRYQDIFPLYTNVSSMNETYETSTVHLKMSNHISLSNFEYAAAIKAGDEAIIVRRLADSLTKSLPSPSPNARHHYVMSTSQLADQLALVGVAELAATKKVESDRLFTGKPTSFGSTLDVGWASKDICKANLNIKCSVRTAKYRTFDGSCNHPLQFGKAFTPYGRTLPPDYADKIESPRVGRFGTPLPSARKVSLQVILINFLQRYISFIFSFQKNFVQHSLVIDNYFYV